MRASGELATQYDPVWAMIPRPGNVPDLDTSDINISEGFGESIGRNVRGVEGDVDK